MKVINIILAAVVLVGCAPKTDPTPKPTIPFKTVEVCADTIHLIRHKDEECEKLQDGVAWRYISDRGQAAELPAVGEKITQTSSGTMPIDVTIGRVPDEGGRFIR